MTRKKRNSQQKSSHISRILRENKNILKMLNYCVYKNKRNCLLIIIPALWQFHGIVIAASSLCQGGRIALSRHYDYIAIVLRLRCNHSTIKTQSHRPDVVIAPPSHMKRHRHLIEMTKASIRNIGTIVPIGAIEFIKSC